MYNTVMLKIVNEKKKKYSAQDTTATASMKDVRIGPELITFWLFFWIICY